MVDFGIGAAVGAIGNLISGKMNNDYQRANMREQMEWQEKMNLQQQEWQEYMWNKTNEYNTPQAQLDRMVQAGINPNNAAMQVAGGSNNATMAAQPDIPSAPNGFSPGFDIMRGVDSLALLKSQKDNIDADTKKKEEEAGLTAGQSEEQQMKNSVWMTNWNVDLAAKKANIDLTKQQKDNLQYQFDVLFPQEEEMNEKQIDLLTGTGIKMAQEVTNLKKENKLIGEQIKTEQSKQGVLASEAALNKAKEKEVNESAKTLEYENMMNEVKAKIAKELKVDVRDLDAISAINLELSKAGYSEQQIESFWEATRGDLSSRFQNGLVNMLDKPVESGSAIAGAISKVRGKGKRGKVGVRETGTIGNSSVANPQYTPRQYKSKTVYKYE